MKLTYVLSALSIGLISFSAFPQQSKIELISSTQEETILKVSVTGFDWKTVKTPQGDAKVISVNNGTPIIEIGEPDLPKLTTSINISDFAEMKVKSTITSFTDFENMNIAPSKGNQYGNINPDNATYFYGNNYKNDTFIPTTNASLRSPQIMPDLNSLTITINPIQYNPVTKTLRLCNEIIVTVSKDENAEIISPIFRENSFKKLQTGYKEIDARFEGITIFPNPTSKLLNIQIENEFVNGNAECRIYNEMGQMVNQFSINRNLSTIDVSSLSSGIYSLNAITENMNSVRKFIVE